MNYRADIDGIRAIAVLVVVLFHLKIGLFKGGYIGVDIFYVISGYLVSAQILSRLEQGTFRLGEFYTSRIRRLLPALFATVGATFVTSAFILLPGDFERFSVSAISALASVSNILFFSEAGYWDHAGKLKPLLHTWSLGVEEQFYLFWPLLFMLLFSTFRLTRITLILVIITVVGLILSEWMTVVNSSAAFYLFPFRIFQFAAGALAFRLVTEHSTLLRLFNKSWTRSLTFLTSGLVILACSMAYSGNTPFPGLWALPPTIATMLLLMVTAPLNKQPFIGTQLLSLTPMVWLGKLSYSLYLVHWPIVSLYLYTNGHHGALDLQTQLVLFAAMITAAVALHYGVETRFYRRAGQGNHTFFSPSSVLKVIVMSGVIMAIVATSAWQFSGWQWRFPDLKFTETQISQGAQDRFKDVNKTCFLQSYWDSEHCNLDAPIQVLVYGNSLEIDAYTFLKAGYASQTNINFIRFGSLRTCEKSLRKTNNKWLSTDKGCQQKLDAMYASHTANKFTHVVFSSPYSYDNRSTPYLRTIADLKSINPNLQPIIFGPYLILKRECSYFSSLNKPQECVKPSNVSRIGAGDPNQAVLTEAFNKLGAKELDRVEFLCGQGKPESCAHSTPDGYPVFWDTRHFSYEFAKWSGIQFANQNPKYFDDSE